MSDALRMGFTGTRAGMTDPQRRSVIEWLGHNWPAEFHHGCCVGADEDAFDIVASHRDIWPLSQKPRAVAHPPENKALLCQSILMFSDEKRPPAGYLRRNRNIVDACDVLLACPAGQEVTRSGTWSTVRYARKLHKKIFVVYPDGFCVEEFTVRGKGD